MKAHAFIAEPLNRLPKLQTAFGCPRDFMGNRFVYAVVSPRARGLSVDVNMNPDRVCNFDCGYCEVDRSVTSPGLQLDLELMGHELTNTLEIIHSDRLKEFSIFSAVPRELLQLRHVALSGDGEPTLCPDFDEAVQTVAHVRAVASRAYFKIVLITNASGLHLQNVQQGLCYLTKDDEIWAKLDAGSQGYMNKVNCGTVPLETVLSNILLVAKRRPVIIQSLFPALHGQEPPASEIKLYAERLRALKEGGAQIPLVQIYSATRPMPHSECSHLSLRSLSRIAATVREIAGLKSEVF